MRKYPEFIIFFSTYYQVGLLKKKGDPLFWSREFITALLKRNLKTISDRSSELAYITVNSITKRYENRYELKIEYAYQDELDHVYQANLSLSCNSIKIKEIADTMYDFNSPLSSMRDTDIETGSELHPGQLEILRHGLVKIDPKVTDSSEQQFWDKEFRQSVLSAIEKKIFSNRMSDLALQFPADTKKLVLLRVNKVAQTYKSKIYPIYRFKVLPYVKGAKPNELICLDDKPIIILLKLEKYDLTNNQRTNAKFKMHTVLPNIKIIDIYTDCPHTKNIAKNDNDNTPYSDSELTTTSTMPSTEADYNSAEPTAEMQTKRIKMDFNNNNNISEAEIAAKTMTSSLLSKKHKTDAKTSELEPDSTAEIHTPKKVKLEFEFKT